MGKNFFEDQPSSLTPEEQAARDQRKVEDTTMKEELDALGINHTAQPGSPEYKMYMELEGQAFDRMGGGEKPKLTLEQVKARLEELRQTA